ncbi:MAG TPA: hypothetical protein DHV59_02225 [Oxalobacteraceae bacterium]|nr:hypothetical protein [Oxalobacteraceae bacterium]
MSNGLFVFNGIDAITGGYLLPEMSAHSIAALARGEPPEPAYRELKYRYESGKFRTFGPVEGVDPGNLAEAGWGVIFAHDADPGVREALRPLLVHRQAQAGPRYREYWGADGYRPQESKPAFLARHKHGPGAPDPERVPYYLLLVGDPEAISYRFQYLLDVQFAVGRICFDAIDDYAHYASSVVSAETMMAPRPKKAAFFGVRNPGDQATQLSADELVAPLSAKMAQANADWEFVNEIGSGARKSRLADLLGGAGRPRLFFSACHGMGFAPGHPLQRSHQGALLCQDWSGPLQHRGAVGNDLYFAGDDIGDEADLSGMIAFFFACYGAGTPWLNDFSHQSLTHPQPIAPSPFVAKLPQRMLSLQKGGALAVIGHVERAWGCSFSWPGVGTHHQVFSAALQRLLDGMPVGHALEYFNTKYAELSTVLSSALEEARYAAEPDDLGLASLWTELNDARSYIVIGDPAVRFT